MHTFKLHKICLQKSGQTNECGTPNAFARSPLVGRAFIKTFVNFISEITSKIEKKNMCAISGLNVAHFYNSLR